RASDGELFHVVDVAADLDAAVPLAVLQAHLALELEVAVLLFTAQEGVELQAVGGGGAGNGGAVDLPVLHQAFPVVGLEEIARRPAGQPPRPARSRWQKDWCALAAPWGGFSPLAALDVDMLYGKSALAQHDDDFAEAVRLLDRDLVHADHFQHGEEQPDQSASG